MSSTSARNNGNGGNTFDSDRSAMRDLDSRDRYNYRGRGFDGDNDRIRDGRSNTLRPKHSEGDQDSDGWSTVKPRKSFGTEGAERFNMRMGTEKPREERRFRDREEKEGKERPTRGFDSYSRDSRDRDHEHGHEGGTRRNGIGKGRSEQSWFRDSNEPPPTPRDRTSNGDKYADRSRGWRERDRDERPADRAGDRDRRWDRDRDHQHRQEKEPEWMDEPAEEKSHGHTQEDFERWKEAMAGKDGRSGAGKAPMEEPPSSSLPDLSGQASFFGLDNPKMDKLLAIETGPDKFFGKFLGNKEEPGPMSPENPKPEGQPAARPGKASRFTSFFSPQEEVPKRHSEITSPTSAPPPGGLGALFSNSNNDQSAAEKEAFQALLQKLQRQSLANSSTPPADPSYQPKPPPGDMIANNPLGSPDVFQQYRSEVLDEQRPSSHNSQQHALQDLLNQRNSAGSQPSIRPEQMLQELVGQRQNALSQSSVRSDQPQGRNKNTEFLMGLMQGSKNVPDPQRTEQILMGMRLQQKPVDSRQLQQQQFLLEREQELQREALAQRDRSASQRQTRPPPPGFFDDPAFQRGPPAQHENAGRNPPQPTQILQRPPPPGLEQLPPNWAPPPPGQLPPPQQRHIAPPPGLAGPPNRGMPMPQQMLPPGFPMQNFLPPEPPMGGPPRNMQPPPGFFNGPPPGFIPPGMSGFQGPEGMVFGGPFDGRGPPPQAGFRRQ